MIIRIKIIINNLQCFHWFMGIVLITTTADINVNENMKEDAFEPKDILITDPDPSSPNVKLSTLLQGGESVVIDDTPQTTDIFCHSHRLIFRYPCGANKITLLMVLMDEERWSSLIPDATKTLPPSLSHYRFIMAEKQRSPSSPSTSGDSTFEKTIHLPVAVDPSKKLRCLILGDNLSILWKGTIGIEENNVRSGDIYRDGDGDDAEQHSLLMSKSFFGSKGINLLKNNNSTVNTNNNKNKNSQNSKIETLLKDPFWKLFDDESSRKIVESMYWVDIPPNRYVLGQNNYSYSYKLWKPPAGQDAKGTFIIFGCYTFAYTMLARELSSNYGFYVIVTDLFVALQNVQEHKCPFRPLKEVLSIMRTFVDLFASKVGPTIGIADSVRASHLVHYMSWQDRLPLDGVIFLNPVFGMLCNSKLRSIKACKAYYSKYIEQISWPRLILTLMSNGRLYGKSMVVKGRMPKLFFEYSETTNSMHNGNLVSAIIIPNAHRKLKKIQVPIMYCVVNDSSLQDGEGEKVGKFVREKCFSSKKSQFLLMKDSNLLSIMTNSSRPIMDWVHSLGFSALDGFSFGGGFGGSGFSGGVSAATTTANSKIIINNAKSTMLNSLIEKLAPQNPALAEAILQGLESGNLLHQKGIAPEHLLLPYNLIRRPSAKEFKKLYSKSLALFSKRSLLSTAINDPSQACGLDFIPSSTEHPMATMLFLAPKISVPFLVQFANRYNIHIIRQDPFLRSGGGGNGGKSRLKKADLSSPLSFLGVGRCNLITLRTNYPSAPLFLGGIDSGANLSLLFGRLLTILEDFQPEDGTVDRKNYFQTLYQKVNGLLLICKSASAACRSFPTGVRLTCSEEEILLDLGIYREDNGDDGIERDAVGALFKKKDTFSRLLTECNLPKFVVSETLDADLVGLCVGDDGDGDNSVNGIDDSINGLNQSKTSSKPSKPNTTKKNISVLVKQDNDMRKMAEWMTGISDLMSKSSQHYKRLRVQDLVPLDMIGIGGFGRVYLVKHGASGHYMALKVMDKESIVEAGLEVQVESERSLLQKSKEVPFVVSYQGSFQTNERLYIGMEFIIGGELGSLLKRKKVGGIPCTWIRFYMAELLTAIEGLHSLSILHRDIKLENILLDALGHISLVDFGFAKQTAPAALQRTDSFCGSPYYMAPEIIKLNRVKNSLYDVDGGKSSLGDGGGPSSTYGMEVDLWSFGVVMYQLLEGKPPFVGRNCRETYRAIINNEPVFSVGNGGAGGRSNGDRSSSSSSSTTTTTTLTDNAVSLITDLLSKTAEKRPTIAELKNYAFFQGINWNECASRLLIPPFQPKYCADGDISNYPRLNWESFRDFEVDPPKKDEFEGFQKSI